MAGERILVVDDDDSLRQVIDQYLQSEGFQTREAADGPQALASWQAERPDLIVLDWMLPGTSGVELLRQMRQQDRTPVIMLTARAEEPDRLIGLEMGADDYLTKPFSLRELAARIRAVLRRARPETEKPEILAFGEVRIDLAGRTVQRGGEVIGLTATEFRLLEVLCHSPGRVFTRLQLMEAAVGEYYEGYERTIDSHISHLRRKLGDGGLIQTAHGMGYKLVPPKG